MQIELKEFTIKEICQGYQNSAENGVSAYNGLLDIRPKYQREFVYKDEQRDAVIDSILKGYPLNVMYWVKNSDGRFEVLDGQQRTISFCEYVTNVFSIKVDGSPKIFDSLSSDIQERVLNYRLFIYICDGTDSEKLAWFKIINIAGEQLLDQEIRNAVYAGSFVSAAKDKFSKRNCPAYALYEKYLSGSCIRQDYLQTALKWISKGNIENYMNAHKGDTNADELWTYFKNVLDWVGLKFNYRKEMKGIDWGKLYDRHKDDKLDKDELERRILELLDDDEVQNLKGIYEYVLNGNERALHLRAFSDKDKRKMYEKQKGICKKCKKHFEIEQMQADHITPWSKGGKTELKNCQMLCADCNRRKSDG